MSKPMGRSWTIEAVTQGRTLSVAELPMHRLTNDGAKRLLWVLVARLEELSPREIVHAHLNRRRGGPPTFDFGEPTYFMDPENGKAGYRIQGPTVFAEAWWPLSDDECSFIRTQIRKTQGR